MPPRPQDIIRVQKWSGVALGMLFLWQFIIVGWSILLLAWANLLSQCCEGRPWELGRANILLTFLLLGNVAIFVTLLTELYFFIDDKLTVNLNLGIQIGKTVYVGGIWIWRLVGIIVSCSKYHCSGANWSELFYALLIQTALFELPFFIAFGFAVYWKVKSVRWPRESNEEVLDEETPLLAEDLGAPPAEPLPSIS